MVEPHRKTVEVPDPPTTFRRDPLSYTWEPDTPIIRCHSTINGPREFLPGKVGSARFSAFRPARAKADLPVLYGADDSDGALSETILRNVPVTGVKRIERSAFEGRSLSVLASTRQLNLADLRSIGLRRIGLTREQLIESDERFYLATAKWAKALHAAPQRFDGLMWMSRQNDACRAIMLFGDRVAAQHELNFAAGYGTRPLGFGAGRQDVDDICDRADITVVDH